MGVGLKCVILSCLIAAYTSSETKPNTPNTGEPLPISAELPNPAGPPALSPDPVANIQKKLKDAGIFDEQNVTLQHWQKEELRGFWEIVKIMALSRARQPDAAQCTFATIRELERLMRKLQRKGKISDELAGMFHWEKL